MSTEDESTPVRGSVTLWLGDLKNGGQEAAQPLWERYFNRLIGLARSRLGPARARAVADEEDVVQNAFNSFFNGVAQGRFSRLDDRNDLWRLLAVITIRKAVNQHRCERRQVHGGDKVFEGPDQLDDLMALAQPTPAQAAIFAEEVSGRLGMLNDEERAIALLKMEGYTDQEIAKQIGHGRATVTRRLQMIRTIWTEKEGDE
jgi:RNA polymerase sigma factor (sigma-70 family)